MNFSRIVFSAVLLSPVSAFAQAEFPPTDEPVEAGTTEEVPSARAAAARSLRLYQARAFEEAASLLLDTLDQCEKTLNSCSTKEQAELTRNLGIVYAGGMDREDDAQAAFRAALDQDSTVELPARLLTPQVQRAFERAKGSDAPAKVALTTEEPPVAKDEKGLDIDRLVQVHLTSKVAALSGAGRSWLELGVEGAYSWILVGPLTIGARGGVHGAFNSPRPEFGTAHIGAVVGGTFRGKRNIGILQLGIGSRFFPIGGEAALMMSLMGGASINGFEIGGGLDLSYLNCDPLASESAPCGPVDYVTFGLHLGYAGILD